MPLGGRTMSDVIGPMQQMVPPEAPEAPEASAPEADGGEASEDTE